VNVEMLTYGWLICVGLVMVGRSRKIGRTEAEGWVSSGVIAVDKLRTRWLD